MNTAGYSDQVATKTAHQILRRPLVRSALTAAMEQQGLTLEQIIQPVIDALQAKKYIRIGDKLAL